MLSKLWVVGMAAISSISIAHTQTLPVHPNIQVSTECLLAVGRWSLSLAAFQRTEVPTWISVVEPENPLWGWLNADWHSTIPSLPYKSDVPDGDSEHFSEPDAHDGPPQTVCLSRSLPGAASSGADMSTRDEADRGGKHERSFLSENRQQVQWKSLLRGELLFLATMHAYRVGTEASTREALQNGVGGGYFSALAALHGWSDGDGYYETYLGHPIQGAVAGYMWIHNDPKYRVVEFGRNRDYWMSRMRAYAWSYVEIEQFKVGLLSEATIGQISRYCCAYGFNDHVITSNGGLVWMVGEDAIDRYIVRKIEDHTHNVPVRILARVGLNPVQGMANLMNLQYPWHRENRASPSHYDGEPYLRPEVHRSEESSVHNLIPTFEATTNLPSIMWFSNIPCVGGSGVLGFRASTFWQWTGEVGGCMLLGKSKGWSGDSLTFTMGPQWVLRSTSRWIPHVYLRVGGQKITEEYCQHYGPPPAGLHPGRFCQDLNSPTHPYAQHFETTGAALSTGAGLDLRLTRALSLRLADFSYVHTWVPSLNGTDFSGGVRLSMGMGLQIGTW